MIDAVANFSLFVFHFFFINAVANFSLFTITFTLTLRVDISVGSILLDKFTTGFYVVTHQH